MINDAVFGNWMAALGARIAKEAPDQLLAYYYKTLSEHLDTAQFEAAMARMISRPSSYYTAWPSPTEIIEAGQAQGAFHAGTALAELEHWLRLRVPNQPIIPQLEAQCDLRAVRVFEALGGAARYDRLTRFNEDDYRREFRDRLTYVAEHEAVGQLAALTAEPAVSAALVFETLPSGRMRLVT